MSQTLSPWNLASLSPGLSDGFSMRLHVTVHGAYAHGPGDSWTSLAFLIAIPGSQTDSQPWAMAWQQISTGVACFRSTPPVLLDQIRPPNTAPWPHGPQICQDLPRCSEFTSPSSPCLKPSPLLESLLFGSSTTLLLRDGRPASWAVGSLVELQLEWKSYETPEMKTGYNTRCILLPS